MGLAALDEMMARRDRHQVKASLKEFIGVHMEVAVSLLRRLDPARLTRYVLADTRNSTPCETLATLMLSTPRDAASILSPVAIPLIDGPAEQKDGFLGEMEKALPWVPSLTSDEEKLSSVYREFLSALGKERFQESLESGWANAKYTIGYPDTRTRLEKGLASAGLERGSYDPPLLDDSLLDPSILAEASKTKGPLGQQSPWAVYLYEADDNDLEWWENCHQTRTLELVGSDPNSVQMVVAADPYSSLG